MEDGWCVDLKRFQWRNTLGDALELEKLFKD